MNMIKRFYTCIEFLKSNLNYIKQVQPAIWITWSIPKSFWVLILHADLEIHRFLLSPCNLCANFLQLRLHSGYKWHPQAQRHLPHRGRTQRISLERSNNLCIKAMTFQAERRNTGLKHWGLSLTLCLYSEPVSTGFRRPMPGGRAFRSSWAQLRTSLHSLASPEAKTWNYMPPSTQASQKLVCNVSWVTVTAKCVCCSGLTGWSRSYPQSIFLENGGVGSCSPGGVGYPEQWPLHDSHTLKQVSCTDLLNLTIVLGAEISPGEGVQHLEKADTRPRRSSPAPFLGWYHDYAVPKQWGGVFTNQTDLVLIPSCLVLLVSLWILSSPLSLADVLWQQQCHLIRFHSTVLI